MLPEVFSVVAHSAGASIQQNMVVGVAEVRWCVNLQHAEASHPNVTKNVFNVGILLYDATERFIISRHVRQV